MEIKVPFTKPLTVLLTKDMPAAQQQADEDIKAIDDGTVTMRHPANEAYFHRLRRRIAEHPELAEKIAVFFQDENGKLHEIGLGFEHELRWPVGFCSELWDEETEIQKVRHDLKTQTK